MPLGVLGYLPGRAPNCVQALIPDDRVMPGGFHDVTLVDLSTKASPLVSMEEILDDSGRHRY